MLFFFWLKYWTRAKLVSKHFILPSQSPNQDWEVIHTQSNPYRPFQSSHLKAEQPSKRIYTLYPYYPITHSFTNVLTLLQAAYTKLVAIWQDIHMVNLLHDMIPCHHLQLCQIMFPQTAAACYFATWGRDEQGFHKSNLQHILAWKWDQQESRG